LYGLKQSLIAWFEKFTQSMKKQEYIQGLANHTLFAKFSPHGKITILILYVDDIVLIGDNIESEIILMHENYNVIIKDPVFDYNLSMWHR
jgi:hypothetical protein